MTSPPDRPPQESTPATRIRWLLRSGLAGAAAPVIAGYFVFQFLCVAVGVVVLGGDGHVVNGEIRTYGLSHGILLYVGVTLSALIAAHVAAVVIVVLIAAGLLLERPVTAGSAARTAARRTPALAGAVPLVGLVLLAVPLLGAGGFLLTLRVWPGVFGCVAGGMLSCWAVLALPLVVLDGAGPVRALARAWTLTRHRRTRWSWTALISVLVVPGAIAAGGWWAVWPLTGEAHAVAVRVTVAAAASPAVLLQGAALAVLTLSQWYADVPVRRERRRPLDLGAAAERLRTGGRGAAGPGRTAVLLALATAAPALFHWAVLRADPYDWVMVSDHVVEHAVGRDVLLLPGRGDPAVLVPRRGSGFDLRACDDPACRRSRLAEHVPYVEDRVDAAALPGGSLVVAGWQYGDRRVGPSRERPLLLRLIACTARGCPDMRAAPTTLRASRHGLAASVAVAASGARTVVAVAVPLTDEDANGGASTLRIMRCAHLPCGDPAVLVSLPVPQATGVADKPLALALGRSGRPVAAYEDLDTGELIVVGCREASCRRHRAASLVPRRGLTSEQKDDAHAGRKAGFWAGNAYPDGVEVAVPADDRPVIAYRDILTGAATLLRCRTPACAAADATVLSPPGRAQQAPALALGPDGLPLVAVHDLTDSSVVLIACRDAGCIRRDRVRIGTYTDIPGPMDLAVGRDGRPRILWIGRSAGRAGNEPHLTTCRRARCAPGGAAFRTNR
ncbi:hypothetical protein [Actinomadura chokoriensis]|uniref:hypothetical protein n=1 Tax=Actinomadura chokoriensis TaxID=454156 RepID=UPI0031F87FF2